MTLCIEQGAKGTTSHLQPTDCATSCCAHYTTSQRPTFHVCHVQAQWRSVHLVCSCPCAAVWRCWVSAWTRRAHGVCSSRPARLRWCTTHGRCVMVCFLLREEGSCRCSCLQALFEARCHWSTYENYPPPLHVVLLQVRRDACQALAVLAASLQFRTLPAGHSATSGQPELVQTPAVELLIAHKPIVLQVSCLTSWVVICACFVRFCVMLCRHARVDCQTPTFCAVPCRAGSG